MWLNCRFSLHNWRRYCIKDNTFIRPPFPAFITPGFPLGSDEFGRDIWSRLLWAIRPTVIMVVIVSVFRLIVGTLIGLTSGWYPRQDKWLRIMISIAVSVPSLFVSLFIISATGFQLGIWAFILGLILTGWGDSARLFRDQTRSYNSVLFIEASQALGASKAQNLFYHILPQLMPVVWMQFAFEISSTLLVCAQLGVLGFFINTVWIPVDDWVGMRTSGMPELGQMLSDFQKQPWGALAAGGIVFITILGFNLLGEGLKNLGNRKLTSYQTKNTVQNWLNLQIERIFDPLSSSRRLGPVILGIIIILAVAAWGGIYLWQSQNIPTISASLAIPGGHLWAAVNKDAQNTRFFAGVIVERPKAAWLFDATQGQGSFSSGPVIAKDGTIYIATLLKELFAISANGTVLWKVNLSAVPVDSPVLSHSGTIFLADSQGGVTAVTPKGIKTQVFAGKKEEPALTSPVISKNERIFLLTTTDLISLKPSGDLVWRKSLPSYGVTNPNIRLSPDYRFVIFEDMIFLAEDGTTIAPRTPNPLDMVIIGTDGNTYIADQTSLRKITVTEDAIRIDQTIRWDATAIGSGFRYTNDVGVSPDGKIWMFYNSSYQYLKFNWLDRYGSLLTSLDYPFRGGSGKLIAVDSKDTAVVCGLLDVAECRANRLGSGMPIWKIAVPAIGGAVIPRRLYLAGTDGFLYAFDE